jgi:sugar lactone lactonase YvrE
MYVQFRPLILSISLAVAAFSPTIAQDAADPALKQSAIPARPYGIITAFAGDSWPGYYGDGGLAVDAELSFPEALVVDSAGDIYIADTDNHVVRKVSAATGKITTHAGTAEAGYAGDHGPATKALLGYPSALSLDSAGNLYIADSGYNVVRKVDSSTGIISTVAGREYRSTNPPNCEYSGDNGPATRAELCAPQGLAVDKEGDLFISDTDNDVVRKVDAQTGNITTVAGVYRGGLYGPASAGVPATSIRLSVPSGLAVDKAGNLYIADAGNCLIRKVNASTGIATIAAGAFVDGFACTSSTDNGIPATEARLQFPAGIALDSAGNLFIADQLNNLIRRVDAESGIITTVAGQIVPFNWVFGGSGAFEFFGDPGYSGDGGAATFAAIDYPQGVSVDAAGNLYIADTGNSIIRKVALTRAATTAAPEITPATIPLGLGFAGSQQVTFRESEPGATIYYTTDGTTPTTKSTRYTGPIQLSKTATVIAFASALGRPSSYAVEGQYDELPAPVISPNGGRFPGSHTVTITESNPYALVLYTIDGSTPNDLTSYDYVAPFTVKNSLTVKAVALLGGVYSKVSTAMFVISGSSSQGPAATTDAAVDITEASATLKATVVPGSALTSYWFVLGSNLGCSPNYGNNFFDTPGQSLKAGAEPVTVSYKLTGLTKNCTYSFEIQASSVAGATNGQFVSFTTAK